MDTPLRQRLANDGLRVILSALNEHEIFGPKASGDGDIIEWWFGITSLAILHILTIETLAGAISSDTTVAPSTAPSSLDNEDFRSRLHRDSEHIFHAAFLSPNTSQLAEWRLLLELMDAELAEQWGGRRVRIPKRLKRKNSRNDVALKLQLGISIRDIPKATGVSRATVYRILKEKK